MKIAVTASTSIREVLGWHQWRYHKCFVIFLSPSRQIPRLSLDRFFPNPFQFINHPIIRQYIGIDN
jgi:hypothetical protein